MRITRMIVPAALAGVGAAIAARARKSQADYSFEGKVALITGGSRGLGLVIARQLANEGAKLAIVARNGAELESAAQDLAAHGAQVLTIKADLSKREEAESIVRRVVERFGRVDVIVNNAGVIQVGPLEHMQVEDFESAMNIHLWGPFHIIRNAVPHMRRQGGGRIVNITSIGGKIAVPHLLPYAASKFALVGLSDGLRAELARHNIHVTTVAPGLMRTGSPVNAYFKGHHQREYAWFLLFDSLPFTSTDSVTAARQIIEACRRGDPDLTITIQARLAIVASTLAPGLFARSMQLLNHFLPKAVGHEGDELKSGWESQTKGSHTALARLARPTYEAAERNNETVTRGA